MEILADFIRVAKNQSEYYVRILESCTEEMKTVRIQDYFQSHLQCHICKHRKDTRKEILPSKSDNYIYIYIKPTFNNFTMDSAVVITVFI